jgi:hypothetical protein
MPEHRMQMKTPRFQDAHRGCLLRLQSAQDLLLSNFTNCFSVARFCSALLPDVERDMLTVARALNQSRQEESKKGAQLCRETTTDRLPIDVGQFVVLAAWQGVDIVYESDIVYSAGK